MSQEFIPTKPDYIVSALYKDEDRKGHIGVAWNSNNGNIRIKFNPFVYIDPTRTDLVITLFPNKPQDRNDLAQDKTSW